MKFLLISIGNDIDCLTIVRIAPLLKVGIPSKALQLNQIENANWNMCDREQESSYTVLMISSFPWFCVKHYCQKSGIRGKWRMPVEN